MNRLMVILGLDAKQFKSGASQASSYATTFATSLRNSMLAALGPIAIAMQVMSFIKGAFDEAKSIADMSKRFDVSSDALQRMASAGKKVGLEMSNIAQILKSFKKSFADAFKNDAAVNDLLALGFTMEEIKSGGVDAQTAILRLSEALDKAGNKTEFMQRLTAAFGRSAGDIMTMLSMSTEELNSSFREAALMSKAQIDAADELGDAWDGMLEVLKPVAMIIVGLLAMIVGAIGVVITSLLMYFSAILSWVSAKFAEFFEWLARKVEKIPKIGKDMAAGLRTMAQPGREAEAALDKATLFFGRGAQQSGKVVGAGFDALTMGAFKDEKAAKPARRDTESMADSVGADKKGGGGASYGVSGMAVVGGGGLVGGGYDATAAVAVATLDVARQQLIETKVQTEILKKASPLSR